MDKKENSKQFQAPSGRLVLLGLSSLILSMSFIMAVFAPFPLSLASVIYGRFVGYLLGVACLGVILFISLTIFKQTTMFFFYGVAFLLSIFITEIVLRGMTPMKGIVRFGVGFFVFLILGGGIIVQSSNLSLKEMVIAEVKKSTTELNKQKEEILNQNDSDEAVRILNLLSQPEELAQEIIKTLPSYFFISIFFVLWANLYLVLKSRRMLFITRRYKFNEENLLRFKMPEQAIWFLVLGLFLSMWGSELFQTEWASDIGLTVVKCLGLFYFFQGFGIYIQFLDHIRLTGLLRTFLVMFTVLIAPWLLALGGVFDMWIDFKKFFSKNKND